MVVVLGQWSSLIGKAANIMPFGLSLHPTKVNFDFMHAVSRVKGVSKYVLVKYLMLKLVIFTHFLQIVALAELVEHQID